MRARIFTACILLGLCAPAGAQVSIGFGVPGLSIGINLRQYPQFEPVPGYPVYYAPGMDANFFFYDGLYWVYAQDNWYASSWYDGPWDMVDRYEVPYFVLRVPVRYYRRPPVYFRGWVVEAAPRWGDHWGRDWTQRRGDWDRWNRNSVPARAPLPMYQRDYSGSRYPRGEQQQNLLRQNYRYEPREAAVRERWQQSPRAAAPARNPPRPESRPEPRPVPDARETRSAPPADARRGNGASVPQRQAAPERAPAPQRAAPRQQEQRQQEQRQQEQRPTQNPQAREQRQPQTERAAPRQDQNQRQDNRQRQGNDQKQADRQEQDGKQDRGDKDSSRR